MSPARPWTAWWLPKGTIRTISRVGIISFIGARSWTPSLCRARSRLSCSASTLSPTCGRALGFLRTINREGLHFRWRNSYTQSYILKWLNRVGPKFFETMEIPLVLGRGIGEGDTETAPKVAVVNEKFVRETL